MAAEALDQPGQSTVSRSADSLRQRQRDRTSPRGLSAKALRPASSASKAEGAARNGITFQPAPRARTKIATAGTPKMRKAQTGTGKKESVRRTAEREMEQRKSDPTSEGASVGREGRQFTVSNVGNNGRIYLRPTVRPANQRYPQSPSIAFPITPPSTAGLDNLQSQSTEADEPKSRRNSRTPSRSPSTSVRRAQERHLSSISTPTQAPRPRRPHSYSTIDEHQVAVVDTDAGAFRVVIERPGNAPKLHESFAGKPTLEVPIPSYKLGEPRFSTRGTPFIRGSSYATTEDMRSSTISQRDGAREGGLLAAPMIARRHSDTSPQTRYATIPPSPFGSSSAGVSPVGIAPQRTAIVPDMFDDLTFKPACDHPSVVRYSMSGGIKAATPARLVAEITSPTFVDYDLLSDFFLSFRSFLETADLLYMLIARLRWSVARDDEIGTVVRVRTFVAIRHWILNYFLDDYVVDYELRRTFCDLLNTFVSELTQDVARTKIPLKILSELKKCWRRVCALYWDGPSFDTELGPDIPISPGGIAGSRNPKLDPSFWETHPQGPPRLDGIIEPDFVEPESSMLDSHNFFADVSRAGHIDSMMAVSAPTTPIILVDEQGKEPPLSPTSITSDEVISCSFPTRGRMAGTGYPLGAHPVPASSIYDPVPPIATTPKALTGKRVRPTHDHHEHKRNGSFSDSFRDQRAQKPVEKVLFKSTELLLALPYAGSLVRGNLFPPAQAFFEVTAPTTADRATTLFPGTPATQKGPSAMSGPGMKRLLGSVRRVLSARAGPMPSSSPTQGSFPNIPPLGIRGATINRLPGTAIVPQARPRHTGNRAPMRIDLLGAEVAEDFKKAVQEDAEAEAERLEMDKQEPTEGRSIRSSGHGANLHYSTMRPDTTYDFLRPGNRRDQVKSELTNGSKSIVIVDDTLPFDETMMTGASFTETAPDIFNDPFKQHSGDPTPPSTPPDAPLKKGGRSRVLEDHTRQRSISPMGTPSLILDPRPSPSPEEDPSPSRRPVDRPSMRFRGSSYPKKSLSLRRYASFQSGFTRHRSERSFDATTCSELDEPQRISQLPSVPLPLRILRRRPGGDLRAVSNVGELNTHPLRRPMSTGSIATYSDSIRSSYLLGAHDSSHYVDVVTSDYDMSRSNAATLSLGALAEAVSKTKHVSLFSTHSSQPVMRPSFEKEAQLLAQIPDDAGDDGGVESALLKLEGKYEQRRSDMSGESLMCDITMMAGTHESFGAAQVDVDSLTMSKDLSEKKKNRQNQVMERSSSKSKRQTGVRDVNPTVYQASRIDSARSLSSPQSVESYNSIPLLERGFSDDGMKPRRKPIWSDISLLPKHQQDKTGGNPTPVSSHPNSYDFVGEAGSIRIAPSESIILNAQDSHHSSADEEEDDDDRSDLSSELSLEVISRAESTHEDAVSGKTLPPVRSRTVIKEDALPPHPLLQPPSPPMTSIQSPTLSNGAPNSLFAQKQLPPSPQISPASFDIRVHLEQHANRGASPSMTSRESNRFLEASRKTSVHLPFTLAFDSQVLAQQFTLIEKDALNEIDWKDLIDMRWKDTYTESRSWVDFLRTSEPRGVEVVIARFNLMVKWAVSEIVLTQDLGERAGCITKYIHVAAQCRKYRNFATMTQLTVALTTKDIARLTNTWAYIPAADIQTLKELEILVSPTSNFHSLRAEMEGSGADQGCIPFVGIYTHDLLMNAERPSQIASTPTTEPLINFERCRTDAMIIKNLLRLLEASQLYRFVPIEGITERCLWMAALSDEEITRYGRMIQP